MLINQNMNNKNKKSPEEIWDTIAESFDRTRRKPWEKCIEFIESLPKTSVIADMSCGNGRHLIPAAEHCKQALALDISGELLKISQKKVINKNLNNVSFLHSDIIYIPVKNNTFNAVLYIASLHNIKGRDERIRSLEEVKRIINNGGNALISVWSREQERFRDCFTNRTDSSTELGDITIYWRQNNLNVPRFYHLYSKEEFIEDLKQSGLKIEQISEARIQSKKYTDNYFSIVRKG